MGCKAAVTPVFAAEIAPPHLRGSLVMNWCDTIERVKFARSDLVIGRFSMPLVYSSAIQPIFWPQLKVSLKAELRTNND